MQYPPVTFACQRNPFRQKPTGAAGYLPNDQAGYFAQRSVMKGIKIRVLFLFNEQQLLLGRCIWSSLLSAGVAVPADQVQKFTPCLRLIREIVRLRMFAVGETLGDNAAGSDMFLYFTDADCQGGAFSPKILVRSADVISG